MGISIIILIFIYRLKLKVKRLKMALTLDERVEIVLLSGRQRQVADEFNARHPERNPITHSAVGNMVKRLRKCVECRGEHIEHIMQIINKIPIGSTLFGHPVVWRIQFRFTIDSKIHITMEISRATNGRQADSEDNSNTQPPKEDEI
jgi:hypothetical protein